MSLTLKAAIQALKGRIADAYTAVSQKGGTLPATQDSANLPTAIASIPSGGGAIEAAQRIDRGDELGDYTILYDYDGTMLYAFTQAEIQTLNELPVPYTTHDRITFKNWNYTLAELKASGKWHDVGAVYEPTDGYGEFEFDYRNCKTILTPHIGMELTAAGSITIDWGDGTIETIAATLTNNRYELNLYHTYASAGKYLMRYKPVTEGVNLQGLYVFNDTAKYVVGRCVYPTGALYVSCGCLSFQTENTTYSTIQGIGNTMIETLVLPPTCHAEQPGSSGLVIPVMLQAVIINNNVESVWRGATNISFANLRMLKVFSWRGQELEQVYAFSGNNCIPRLLRSMDCIGLSTIEFVSNSVFSDVIERFRATRMKDGFYNANTGYQHARIGKLKSLPPIDNSWGWNAAGIQGPYLEEAPTFLSGFGMRSDGFFNCYKIRDWGAKYNTSYGIGASYFANNWSLRTFTMTNIVPSIAASAFSNCYSLEEIHIERSAVSDGSITTLANVNAFANCPNSMKIYVPADSVSAYQSATNWATFASQIVAEHANE